MMDKLHSLNQFLRHLQQVPYLASKNMYRVAEYFLKLDTEKTELFCKALLLLKEKLEECTICFVWKEKSQGCLFCDASARDKEIICVVETWHDLLAMERAGGFKGQYHILGGSICPLDGIGPNDLTIHHLIARIEKYPIQEIILAMNQNPEGEATSAYIAMKLKNTTIKITCLARGIPIGSTLEFMDKLTLHKALSERRPF